MNTFNTFYISLPLCKVLQPVSKQRAKWLPSDMWSLQLYSNTPVTVFLLWLALKQKPHTVKNNNSLIFFCLLPNYQVRISNLAQYCPHPWHSKISLTRLHPWERSWAASRVEHNRKAVPAFVTQSSRMFRLQWVLCFKVVLFLSYFFPWSGALAIWLWNGWALHESLRPHRMKFSHLWLRELHSLKAKGNNIQCKMCSQ